jgi:Flp pilus assembly protein TadG
MEQVKEESRMRSIKSYVQRSCARRAGPAREPYLAPKVGLEVEATSPRGNAQGQSLLEFAVILIGLLILFLGLIEVALAMRAKLVLTNANREAARLASRGTFTDEQVANQALLALAGQLQADTETNTGIIVTRFRVPAPDASPPASITHQVYITGTFSYTADSGNVETYESKLIPLSDYEAGLLEDNASFLTAHDVVVVETYYQHYQVLKAPLITEFIADPILQYVQTVMRIAAPRMEE